MCIKKKEKWASHTVFVEGSHTEAVELVAETRVWNFFARDGRQGY